MPGIVKVNSCILLWHIILPKICVVFPHFTDLKTNPRGSTVENNLPKSADEWHDQDWLDSGLFSSKQSLFATMISLDENLAIPYKIVSMRKYRSNSWLTNVILKHNLLFKWKLPMFILITILLFGGVSS